MSTRPSLHARSASTNLGGNTSYRPHEGKVAIVTGASRGIGAAICKLLASRGANLVMNYTSETSAQRTKDLAQELEATHNITTLIVQADMGSINGPGHIIELAKNHFSHPKTGAFAIDILINNAGVSNNHLLSDLDAQGHADDFDQQYYVNVRGPMLLVRAAMQYLPTDRSGRIINLSSVSSQIGLPPQSIYGGTKAALESMTRSWARELSERATVNAVNPGPVLTDMYGGAAEAIKGTLVPYMRHAPLMRARKEVEGEREAAEWEEKGGRPGYDWEVAGVVGMLCTAEAGWTTGCVVGANGGMYFTA